MTLDAAEIPSQQYLPIAYTIYLSTTYRSYHFWTVIIIKAKHYIDMKED